MAENSKIEWTDHTFNPWIGCEKVSQGCKHCYAETFMTRKPRWANTWGSKEVSKREKTSPNYWRNPIKWNEEAKKAGTRRKVFCASLADVFERNDDLIDWRWDLMDLISNTPHLDWLLLTKRAGNILDMVPWQWHKRRSKNGYLIQSYGLWPKNVWVGTSVENQKQADKRIPELLNVPAQVKFLSVEPLLGPIDLELSGQNYGRDDCNEMINWVIVGGESGAKARPMNGDWVRSIRDQCLEAQTPFFFKQWGGGQAKIRAAMCWMVKCGNNGRQYDHTRRTSPKIAALVSFCLL